MRRKAEERRRLTSYSVTSTVTLQPMSTYYAVCGSQNQISSDSRGNRLSLLTDNSPAPQILSVASAYDCCVACIETPNCAGSNFIPSLTNQGANCELAVYDTCPSQSMVTDTLKAKGDTRTVFSNGLCGHYAVRNERTGMELI